MPAGTRLGAYELEEPVGRGASAIVYRARDALGQQVAVKVRQRGVKTLDRRFLREFESLRSVRLPGVVQVYDAGIEDDCLWFSMEFVTGRDFSEVVRAERTTTGRIERATQLGVQLFEVLAGLHAAGFIHRDIKPSNVLVDDAGRVRVLDFGIVRFFGERDTSNSTGTEEVLGTVPFMAPEQLAGLPLTRRVDVFAGGLLLYESIAGERPRPKNPLGWIPRLCLETLTPLACLYRELPRGLSHLVERLLDIDPRRRPTALEAAKALRRVAAGHPSQEWPEPPFMDPGNWWSELEGVIGRKGKAPVWILEGPAGSGRRRVADQLQRQGVMQGVWGLNVRCAAHHVGGPIEELLDAMLTAVQDESWIQRAASRPAPVLRRTWPHLPLPGTGTVEDAPSEDDVAEAVADLVESVARRNTLLVVVHHSSWWTCCQPASSGRSPPGPVAAWACCCCTTSGGSRAPRIGW